MNEMCTKCARITRAVCTGRKKKYLYAGAPGRDRTCDLRFRKPLLYPLSYGGKSATGCG